MQSMNLKLHPAFVCRPVHGIEVELGRDQGRLLLRYLVTGTIADLAIPQPAEPRRADNLWQHSCFEAFIRRDGESAYREFNFAPSGQWAAYRFDGYRIGMEEADIAPPAITTNATADRFELRVSLDIPVAAPSLLALSAVIEETGGRKSYWALAHPPGKADFHHPDSFILELPPPS